MFNSYKAQILLPFVACVSCFSLYTPVVFSQVLKKLLSCLFENQIVRLSFSHNFGFFFVHPHFSFADVLALLRLALINDVSRNGIEFGLFFSTSM